MENPRPPWKPVPESVILMVKKPSMTLREPPGFLFVPWGSGSVTGHDGEDPVFFALSLQTLMSSPGAFSSPG